LQKLLTKNEDIMITKAYRVWDNLAPENGSLMVIATSPSKAKACAMFVMDGAEYTDMRAVRVPCFDKYRHEDEIPQEELDNYYCSLGEDIEKDSDYYGYN
jgi:hypothetical protein